MNFKPILIIPGETRSIFLKFFLNQLGQKFTSPLILICNKEILRKEVKKYKFYKNWINWFKSNFKKKLKKKYLFYWN